MHGGDGNIQIGLLRPSALFSIFYVLYYVAPYLIVTLQGGWEGSDGIVIAGLVLLGCVAWMLGARANAARLEQIKSHRVDATAAGALLVVCLLGMVGVAYGFAWRISEGIFFNQSRYFEQNATVVDSIRYVFLSQVQLPIILLLGMLSTVPAPGVKRMAGVLVLLYGSALTILLIMSSQTRPAVTAALFTILAHKLGDPRGIGMRKLAIVAVVGLGAVAVIQALRVTAKEELAGAENQLIFALRNAISKTGDAIANPESRGLTEEAVLSRASGGVVFLAEIRREVDARGGPFYGEGVVRGLAGLIPRIFWPDKPTTLAPQIVAQELLGFPITYDASLGPLTQFYFEGGWLGVVGGFALLGWFVAWLTKKAALTGSVGWWMAFCFTWGHIANMELEVGLGLITALRGAAAAYLCWLVVASLMRMSSTRQPAI